MPTARYFEDCREAVVVPDDNRYPSGVAAGALDPANADRLWAWIASGPGSLGDELVVHGAVAHQAVSRRHQDGLQDAVPAG